MHSPAFRSTKKPPPSRSISDRTEAASKVLSIVNTLFAAALNLGEPTTVS